MGLVALEIARKHCRTDGDDDDLLGIYLTGAEQAASDFMNRRIYATQQDLDDAADEAGIVINGAIVSAILLSCGHLYANREDVVAGVSVTQLPSGVRELLRPHRLSPGV